MHDPDEIPPLPIASPGLEPGLSSFKARDVAHYTTRLYMAAEVGIEPTHTYFRDRGLYQFVYSASKLPCCNQYGTASVGLEPTPSPLTAGHSAH